VRFSPDVPLKDLDRPDTRPLPYQLAQVHAHVVPPLAPSTSGGNAVTHIVPPISEERLVAVMTSNSDSMLATMAANNREMMQNIGNLFGMAQQNSQQREDVLRSEIQNTIQTNTAKLEKDAAQYAAQVSHLTNTVKTMTRQIDANSDFAVDAVQQVRDELNGRIDAMAKQQQQQQQQQASNAGGVGNALNLTGSSKDVPLVNNKGRPDNIDHKNHRIRDVSRSHVA